MNYNIAFKFFFYGIFYGMINFLINHIIRFRFKMSKKYLIYKKIFYQLNNYYHHY